MTQFKACGYPDPSPSSTFTSFVVPYSGDPKEQQRKGPLDVSKVRFADKEKTKVWIDNPVLTDVTQVEQTDLKHILAANPDINGLSLLLDDAAKDELRDIVSIEDFLEPSQYVDIFDIQDFISNAKNSFNRLPVSLRKIFNNDPFQLIDAVSSKNPAALSALEQYLNPLLDDRQSSGTAVDINSGTKLSKSVSTDAKTQSDASNDIKNSSNKNENKN